MGPYRGSALRSLRRRMGALPSRRGARRHGGPVFGRSNVRCSLPGLLVLGGLQSLRPLRAAFVLHAGSDGLLLLLVVGRGDPAPGGRGGARKRGLPLGGKLDPLEKPL